MCTLLLWSIVLPEEDKAEGAAGSQWPSGPQRSYSQDCNFENNTYSVGDCVYVQPSEANLQPHIVCIEKLWKDEAGAQAHFSFLLPFADISPPFDNSDIFVLTIGCVCWLQVSCGCMDVGFIVQGKLSIWQHASFWRRRYSRATTTTVCLSARSWGNVLCYL